MNKLFNFTLFLIIVGITSAFKIPKISPERFDSTNMERIIGGQNAARYQLPYQVFIDTNPSGALCGGSLISRTCALTAAHCVYQPSDTVDPSTDVIFGILNLDNTTSAEPDRVCETASRVLVHPSFSMTSPMNDIALLFFSAVPCNSLAIIPIALPSDCRDLYVGADVTLSGWGVTSDSATEPSHTLQYVHTIALSNEDCQLQANYVTISDSHICTDGNPAGTNIGGCNGDSGSPLTTVVGCTNTLIGIVSFGSPYGCEAGYPTVFTRITSYLKWIKANKT